MVALALVGCSSRREAAPPPAADPPVATVPPPASGEPPVATRTPPAPAPGTGTVGSPWDTAGRSRETRRAHVYPKGESALGKKLVAALPDPGELAPNEGGPSPSTAPAPASPSPTSPTPAPGADCWQAQLVATADRAQADRVRSEAAALLGVEVSVVSRDGMHRVRAGGCLDGEAALRVVERARGEGWPETFRVRAGS
ncbi:MAG: SPOR domain-containing protein [Candidatus Eisenbacteria bacterium]